LLYISILWVDENYRSKGVGTKLILEAENQAIRRGCKHAHADTMSFQAPVFYKKLHYQIIRIANNIPEGYKKYHFVKEL
jgi:ribosomal protein S18 acetylase RimI-like enzyme